jgi:adenosine deaminase
VLDAMGEAHPGHGRRDGAGPWPPPHPAPGRRRGPSPGSPGARRAAQRRRRVVGFGLSNDETRGRPEEFAKAFRIAREAGLLSVPHAGELRGTRSVQAAVEVLRADRLGHGVRSVEDPRTVQLLAERGVVLEVCPASNVALGVAGAVELVPVRQLQEAGVPVALGADDPLLFRSGLLEQYAAVRDQQGLPDGALAALAADAVRGSAAPQQLKDELLDGVDAWLATPVPLPPPTRPSA